MEMKDRAKESEEPMVNGVPHRLLDGADELPVVSPERLKMLMDSAPDYVKARAKLFAEERGAAGSDAKEKTT